MRRAPNGYGIELVLLEVCNDMMFSLTEYKFQFDQSCQCSGSARIEVSG